MLEEEHGVVVANRGLHQAFLIGGRSAGHDLDAWNSMEVGLKPLAVLSAKLTPNTAGAAHHGGNGEVAPAGVAEHPHVVGDLVEGQEQEAHVHALNDRPETGHRGTNRHSGEAVLSNRGVEPPQIAVFLRQILG